MLRCSQLSKIFPLLFVAGLAFYDYNCIHNTPIFTTFVPISLICTILACLKVLLFEDAQNIFAQINELKQFPPRQACPFTIQDWL